MIVVLPALVALVAGAIAGMRLGSRPRRLLGSFVVAATVIVAALAVFVLTSPTESPDDCSHCNEFFGHWLNGLWFALGVGYLLLFALAAVVVATVRQAVGAERPGER